MQFEGKQNIFEGIYGMPEMSSEVVRSCRGAEFNLLSREHFFIARDIEFAEVIEQLCELLE